MPLRELLRKPVPRRMFNEHRYERAHPSGVKHSVLLLHHFLDLLPGQRRKPRHQPVHHFAEGPQLFAYSHPESVSGPGEPRQDLTVQAAWRSFRWDGAQDPGGTGPRKGARRRAPR